MLWQGTDWLSAPRLLPALIFGVATVVFPFFVMQPASGAGWAASRTPHPWRARLHSLVLHAVFGLGLCACGPAAMVGDRLVGMLTPKKVEKLIDEVLK